MKATYQTRIVVYDEVDRPAGDAALSAYAELYGRVERRLFAEMAAGESAASLKSAYLACFGIPARLFNAVRVSLQGKVASVRESQKLRVDDLRRRIARAKKRLAKASKDGRPDQAHHKRRRLANLEHRLKVLEAELKAGVVRLCFGSRQLWRRRHHLEAKATPATKSGSRTGVMPAKASSSCWVAATRQPGASCVQPALRETGL